MGPAVVIRIEPGGTFRGGDVRINGPFIAQGTPAQPAIIAGGLLQLLCADACATRASSHVQIRRANISAANWTFSQVTATNASIHLGSGSSITNAVLEGVAPIFLPSLSLANDARADQTVVRGAGPAGVGISGSNVTLTNCSITGGAGDGVWVGFGDNVQIRNCVIENNTGMGVANMGLRAPTARVDARFNWWGDPAGPVGPAGDGVGGDVDYSSHLTERPAITATRLR
jgi:hypothetical protein